MVTAENVPAETIETFRETAERIVVTENHTFPAGPRGPARKVTKSAAAEL